MLFLKELTEIDVAVACSLAKRNEIESNFAPVRLAKLGHIQISQQILTIVANEEKCEVKQTLPPPLQPFARVRCLE